MTALADHRNGPARTFAPDGRPAAASVARPAVTCALRGLHGPPAFVSGILARRPRRVGAVFAGVVALVGDS
ncbi:MAG: hypothetical protein ACHP85_25760, partial [Burkholderiales bacterium]